MFHTQAVKSFAKISGPQSRENCAGREKNTKEKQQTRSGQVCCFLCLFTGYRCRLFSSDSTSGASTLASAAIDASVCVHDCNTILDGDSANRASALASAAANTCVRNLVCHNRTLLISRAVSYEETCPCTAGGGLPRKSYP